MAEIVITVDVDERLKHLLDNGNAPQRNAVLKLFVGHWAEFAAAEQRIYAPQGETGYLEEHISHTPAHFHAGSAPARFGGGFGAGGGDWEASAGVRAGSSKHPFYVHFGTANTIPGMQQQSVTALARAIGGQNLQGRIYPKLDRARPFGHRPALGPIRIGGKSIGFRSWVRGQRPQPFVYFSFIHTSVYAKGQLRSIARGMFGKK